MSRADDHQAVIAEDCPFCEYAGPSDLLYVWDDAYAITPLNPVADGHVIVIPNAHVEHADNDPNVAALAFRRAAEIASGDYNLIQSNGAAATQTVKHLHVHVVPRREDDGLSLPWSPALGSLVQQLQDAEADGCCRLCGHEWRRHDPGDGMCDAHASDGSLGVCQCGRSVQWMQARIAALSSTALNASADRRITSAAERETEPT